MSNEKQVEETKVEETAEQKAEKQKRMADCQKQIQKVLTKNNCQFDITVILKAGQVIPQLDIRAL